SEDPNDLDELGTMVADPSGGPTEVTRSPIAFARTEPVILGSNHAQPPPLPDEDPSAADRDRVDAAAVAWSPAMLPEGASPWSEVVKARPTPRRTSEFPGYDGELPEVVERSVLDQRITLPPMPPSARPPFPDARSRGAWPSSPAAK